MNVVVLSALTDRSLLVYSHTGVIVSVLVSLLLFFYCLSVGDDQALQQQHCTALQSRAGRFVFKLYYLLLTSVFYFLKNYFHVANLAIIHFKYLINY
jgi:hypothetical protein